MHTRDEARLQLTTVPGGTRDRLTASQLMRTQSQRFRRRIVAPPTWSFAAGVVTGACLSSLAFLGGLAWLFSR